MPLRIIFMGTPEFSVPTLAGLADAGHQVVAVYCQPARPGGRGMGEKKSPVQVKAEELGIDVFTPTLLKSAESQAQFAAHKADIAVVVAYGLILPRAILDTPRLGCINGHASLLPRWRGAAPIQRAIEAGDTQSGVMIMQMEAGLDTGPVLLGEAVPIPDNMSAGQLHDRLSDLTGELMVSALAQLELGQVQPTPQTAEGVTYAKKLDKSESRINWKRDAQSVHNHIRAMSPFPGAWCEIVLGGKPTRVKILQSQVVGQVVGQVVKSAGDPGYVLDQHLTIACSSGAVRPVRLQKAGGKPCSLEEFLRGNPVETGTVLV